MEIFDQIVTLEKRFSVLDDAGKDEIINELSAISERLYSERQFAKAEVFYPLIGLIRCIQRDSKQN